MTRNNRSSGQTRPFQPQANNNRTEHRTTDVQLRRSFTKLGVNGQRARVEKRTELGDPVQTTDPSSGVEVLLSDLDGRSGTVEVV